MERDSDAFGQEIAACFNKKSSYEIVERDDGYIGLSGGAKSYFAGYKDWPKWQQGAIKLARGRTLDIGCGAGRVCLYLQKKGFDITGIDNSPLAVGICRKRGVKKARVMPIEQISSFGPNHFDTIIMFGNNFGLFGSFSKAKRLLRDMYKITSKDALIIAESNDPYKTKDPVHLSYHKLNSGRGRMGGQLRIRIRFARYTGEWFDYLLVSKEEMREILKGTGWKVKKFINSGKYMYIAVIGK
jgi:SAM-dependent methyltransferase